jgi:hypothetical protein
MTFSKGLLTRKKRRLRNIGLFSPAHWLGLPPDGSQTAHLYYRLKQYGFTETVWQFVYKGQVGGLILQLDGGRKELHVRFYDDLVEAELEVGRNFLEHFGASRYRSEFEVYTLMTGNADPADILLACAKQAGSLSLARNATLRALPRVKFVHVASVIAGMASASVILGFLPPGIFFITTLLVIGAITTLPRVPAVTALDAGKDGMGPSQACVESRNDEIV